MNILQYKEKIIGYIALVFLVYLFAIHGIKALLLSPNFIALITGIGISLSLAKVLLIIVGIVDLLVVAGLLFYRKIWLIIYSGLWPIVPSILVFINTGDLHLTEIVLAPALAGIVYWAFIKSKENKK